jgi:lipoprotein-anchoring transpeptidase ErfK/SrfK
LLIFIIIGIAGWAWWQHGQLPKKNPSKPAVMVITAPAPAKPPPKPLIILQSSPNDFPRPVHGILEAQVALARRAISPGSIDGAIGSQTRMAIFVFQQVNHLPETGRLDTNTRPQLTLDAPLLTTYIVTTNDLAHLQPLGKTWLEKSQQTALDYETELELVAEKSHAHPGLIRQLNPGVDWTNVAAGTVLQILESDYPAPPGKAAFVTIHLGDKFLEAFDAQTNLLAHFPCSIAARVEKRPVGELHVMVVAPNPNYTFDPELFPESSETQRLVLPPGPNNPVGIAWIGLDKTGYGIHGTPAPEQIGRTESHGCFRLANWDAAYLLKLAWIGMPVEVEP